MKALKRVIIAIIVMVVCLIIFAMCTFTVHTNEAAIVMRFGKIDRIETTPGLHGNTPIIESIQPVSTKDMFYDIPTSDVITSDKKSMIANDYVVWAVTDVSKYYQTLSAVKGRAEERIEANVYNATKNIISSMTQDEIIASRGSTLIDKITAEANSDISQYGIVIKVAAIKALDLPDDNKQAVYDRMISERNNIAASYTAKGNAEAQKIRNDTDKQTTVTKANATAEAAKIEAEGEAEYMKILSSAYNDEGKAEFYNFLRGLDSLEALAGQNKTIILDKNSEYARMLYGLQ